MEYDNILSRINGDLGVVIELDTPKDVLKKRITGRYICSECGQTHNILTGVNEPKKAGLCNKCGGKLYQREDDNETSFETRYNTYLEKTLPLINFYKEKGVLHSVKSIDPVETLEEIEAIIND